MLIDISTVLTLVMYAWCALALVRFAKAVQPAGWRLAVRVCAVLAFAFCLWTIVASDQRLLLISLAALAATLPLWLASIFAERMKTARAAAPVN